MISNVNNYYATLKNIEIEQIPEISNPVLDVFAKHVDCAFKPKKMDLCLNTRVKTLNQLNDELIKDKKLSTFSKVLSLFNLIFGISIIAMAAIFIDPLLIITSAIIFPIMSIYYIYDAFTKVEKMQNKLDEKLEPLNERIEMLKKIIENHPVIRQGIQEELAQINLTGANLDMKRVEQLVTALNQLEKSVTLIEKLKN